MESVSFECCTSQTFLSVPASGGPPQGPRLDSHRWETVPLSHLRHPVPPPADPEEPPAHSHRREALLGKSQTIERTRREPGRTFFFFLNCPGCLIWWTLVFPVWKVWPPLSTQEPTAPSPAPETRRRHQHQDPLQGADRALPASPAGLLKRGLCTSVVKRLTRLLNSKCQSTTFRLKTIGFEHQIKSLIYLDFHCWARFGLNKSQLEELLGGFPGIARCLKWVDVSNSEGLWGGVKSETVHGTWILQKEWVCEQWTEG